MAELRYVDWDGLVYYDGKIKEFIRNEAEDYLKMGGIVSSKNLPDPSWQNLNYIYKITDEFTSNDRFENPGYIYPAGTWVQCVNSDNDERWLYIIFNEECIGETADVDLSDYYTKSEVNKKINDAIEGIEFPEVDLSGYYTKDEVDQLIPDDFATQSDIEVIDKAVAETQASIDELQENKADKGDLIGLATEEFVLKKIAEAELADQDVDLSAYYTKSETDAKIQEAVDALEIPDVSVLATKEEVASVEAKVDAIVIPEVPTKVSELENDAGYITLSDIPETDLSNYYNKSETETLITEAVESIEHPPVDLEGYATEEWVNQQGFIKEVPSEYITESELDAKGYLTEHQDLSEYAKKSEVPSIEGLATEDFVKSEIAKAELAGGEITEDDLNKLLSNYYNKSEVESLIPDTSKFITEVPSEYITETELDEKGYLTEHQSLEGYAKLTDIPDVSNFATKDEIPSINGLATEQFVKDEIAKIEYPSLDGYATEVWVNEQGFIKEIPSEYITETELSEKSYITDASLNDYAKVDSIPTKTSQLTNDSNFLTEHQDISGKADKSDLNGLASTEYVDQAIANIPETDVSNLATKEELQTVEQKIPTNYITSIPEEYITEDELDSELEGYATEKFVTDAINNIQHPDTDLSNYYTKTQTDAAISEAVDGIKIPSRTSELTNDSGFITNSDLSSYAKKDELFSKDYNDLANTPEIPSIE